MSCGGLNTFVSLAVPAFNGDGAPVDISGISRLKTVYLSGAFDGKYVLFGSQDNVNYVPVLSFEGGELPPTGDVFAPGQAAPTVKKELPFTLRSLIVRRAADRVVTISVGGQETCPCT